MSGLAAIFGIVLLAFVAGFLVWTTFNSVVSLRQQSAKAWANIDVALQQRHDELPNLVEAVRGLMAYERDTLTAVTNARAAYRPTDPIPAQAATSAATTTAVMRLIGVVEQYPEIHSQRNVLELQHEIERLEAVIADRRALYNDTVYRLNTRIRTFPTNILAWLFDWQPRAFFAPPDAAAGAVAGPPPVDLA
jgi:LemA protein